MNERTFYDVHMHAFNLSHPSLLAFLRRSLRELWKSCLKWRQLVRYLVVFLFGVFLLILLVVLVLVALVPPFRRRIRSLTGRLVNCVKKLLKTGLNMLSVMENDIGSVFLLMEDDLREKNPLLDGDGLHIGGQTYSRIVLTPLMMDFGYKGKTAPSASSRTRQFHYDIPAGKPIVEQVIDVFNGIKTYRRSKTDEDLEAKFPGLGKESTRIFEIYPFLGLNPANYDQSEIEELLDKCFADYKGTREDLLKNLGRFDGNIENLKSNFFAGIKVYPPLGFDPWPETTDPQGRKKVEYLYEYCCEKRIPITTHGGRGGFVVIGKAELDAYTAMSKWAAVLKKEEYSSLKLNLAHFPVRRRNLPHEWKRLVETLKLVLTADNVYVDISCRATSEKYYARLRSVLDQYSGEERVKLGSRILFGSDFAVNLMGVESYNEFLDLFSRTKHLTPEEKLAFCSTNPERFLFG